MVSLIFLGTFSRAIKLGYGLWLKVLVHFGVLAQGISLEARGVEGPCLSNVPTPAAAVIAPVVVAGPGRASSIN